MSDNKDDFARGYLIAVSNLISHIGVGTEVDELMSELGLSAERVKQLGLCDFDNANLDEYFADQAERLVA